MMGHWGERNVNHQLDKESMNPNSFSPPQVIPPLSQLPFSSPSHSLVPSYLDLAILTWCCSEERWLPSEGKLVHLGLVQLFLGGGYRYSLPLEVERSSLPLEVERPYRNGG